jgi:hypothetical protein
VAATARRDLSLITMGAKNDRVGSFGFSITKRAPAFWRVCRSGGRNASPRGGIDHLFKNSI